MSPNLKAALSQSPKVFRSPFSIFRSPFSFFLLSYYLLPTSYYFLLYFFCFLFSTFCFFLNPKPAIPTNAHQCLLMPINAFFFLRFPTSCLTRNSQPVTRNPKPVTLSTSVLFCIIHVIR